MKLLIISHMYPQPGREHYGSFIAEPALELSRRGHQVQVISPVPVVPPGLGALSPTWRELARLPRERQVDGIRVRHPRYLHFPRRIMFAGSGTRMARSVLRLDGLDGWDLIHAHTALPDGGAAGVVAAALGIPWVMTTHGSDVLRATTWSPAVHAATHAAFRAADLILAPSAVHLQRARERGLPCERGRVLWNGFHRDTFLTREPATSGDTTLKLICVANLVPSKRIDHLLAAMGDVRRRGGECRLQLIGSGPESEPLKRQARELELDVEFSGTLKRSDVADALQRADIFALPARGESFGIVYLEAMAAGLPILAPVGEGISDIIETGKEGLLVESDPPTVLADAILELGADPERRLRMGRAARATAGELGWDGHTAKLEKLYAEVLTREIEPPREKILHLLYNSEPDRIGYTMRSRYILLNQRALGRDLQVTTSPFQQTTWSDGPRESREGILYHRLRLPGVDKRRGRLGPRRYLIFLMKFLMDLLLARQVATIIEDEQPSLLHAHSPAFNLFLARRARGRATRGERQSPPLVYEVRGLTEETEVLAGNTSPRSPLFRYKRHLEERAMGQADMVVTLSRGMRDDFIRRGIPAEKIRVVPNGVDCRAIVPPQGDPDLAARLGLTAGKTLGYVGSMACLEGLPWLVEQLAELPSEWRLLLVGDGQDRPAILARGEQLGVSARVVAPGSLPHEQMPAWYGLIDYIVLPRPSFRVTELVTPLKPLEAMAAGRIVLASDIGGHREIVEEGVNGCLFSRENPAGFRELVTALAEDPTRREALGRSAREWVERNRDWRLICRRYDEIYQLAGKSGGSPPTS